MYNVYYNLPPSILALSITRLVAGVTGTCTWSTTQLSRCDFAKRARWPITLVSCHRPIRDTVIQPINPKCTLWTRSDVSHKNVYRQVWFAPSPRRSSYLHLTFSKISIYPLNSPSIRVNTRGLKYLQMVLETRPISGPDNIQYNKHTRIQYRKHTIRESAPFSYFTAKLDAKLWNNWQIKTAV